MNVLKLTVRAAHRQVEHQRLPLANFQGAPMRRKQRARRQRPAFAPFLAFSVLTNKLVGG